MWEIFSGGEMPYSGMRNIEVVDFVINNCRRLPKPEYCPEKVYQVLNLCWQMVRNSLKVSSIYLYSLFHPLPHDRYTKAEVCIIISMR